MTQPVTPEPFRNDSALVPSGALLWLCRLLCVVALVISGYLAWKAFTNTQVGCGAGEVFDCSHVLSSKYAKVLGIPVSAPAFGLYATMLGMSFMLNARMPRRLLVAAWTVLTMGAIAAGLAALWFIGVQVVALGHLCPYCLGAHTCGLLLSAIILWKMPLGAKATSALGGLSAAAVAGMIAVQVNSTPPDAFVIETFDDSGDATESVQFTTDTTDGDGDDIFGAPTDDLFAAPVDSASENGDDDLFAAPGTEEDDSETPVAPGAEGVAGETAPADSDTTSSPPVKVHPAAGSDLKQSTTLNTLQLSQQVTGDADAGECEEAPVTQDNPESPADEPEPEDAIDAGSATRRITAPLLFFSPSAMRVVTRVVSAAALAADADEQLKSDSTAETARQPRKTDSGETQDRIVTVTGRSGKYKLKVRDWPLLGKPDAKYVFVELFDFTCPHCRNTHRAIKGAFEKYGDDLAIIALPVPLESSCNDTVRNTSSSHRGACELARIGIAVWRINPEKYREYYDWMFEGYRTLDQARKKAAELVGAECLEKELKLPHAANYIAKHVELYKRLGQGSVPKLIFPKSTLTGSVSSPSTLCSVIEREFK